MWQEILTALALVFVIEGLLPAISPGNARQTYQLASQLDERTLRRIGVISMVGGALLLYLVKMN